MKEYAVTWFKNMEANDFKCSFCKKDKQNPWICNVCCIVTYCSKRCQLKHWAEHRKTCSLLKNTFKGKQIQLYNLASYGTREMIEREGWLETPGKKATFIAWNTKHTSLLIAAVLNGNMEILLLLRDLYSELNADLKRIVNYKPVKNGGTALMAASYAGYLSITKILLDHEADINAADNEGMTALHWAAREGKVDVAVCLMDQGASVHLMNKDGETALHLAMWGGHVEVGTALIEVGGAEVNAEDNVGWTPLHCASDQGHRACAKMLLDLGAKIDATSKTRRTPLHQACQQGCFKCARMLIAMGADLHSVDQAGASPLLLAIFLEHGCTKRLYEGMRNDGLTTLQWACEEGHLEIAKLLIDFGGKKKKKVDWILLELLCTGSYLNMTKMMAESVLVNVHAVNKDGETLLHSACQGNYLDGHLDIINMLVEMGADINAVTKNIDHGWTPLVFACDKGNLKMARLLVRLRADVDATDNGGMYPLHFACERGFHEIVELLLHSAADLNARGLKDRTPLHCACRANHVDVAKLLIESAADVNALDVDDETPLHFTCQKGSLQIARMLVHQGAKVDIENTNGFTALNLMNDVNKQTELNNLANNVC